MANVIVVGAQWGDEGKAKITDLLAEQADVIVRYQGGCNAGHTVVHRGEVFKFHLIPSGMLYPGKRCVIGHGTVIDPQVLYGEIQAMKEKGYALEGLMISDRAHLTLPHQIEMDKASEASLNHNKIGTTGRGIGPTYADKISRLGLRIGDLYEADEILKEKLARIVEARSAGLTAQYGIAPLSVDSLFAYCKDQAAKLAPYVTDSVQELHEAIENGQSILFEGAQGTLLDVDCGTYPYVTSSNPTAGGACTGSGIGPTMIDRVIGVMKAYTTRVGEGPFPTELSDDMGRHFAEVGREIGTTTGRLRRCGWFDAVIGRYSARVNGLDGLAITKLDVLDGLSEIKVCVAYRHRDTGEQTTRFPSQLHELTRMEPVYETLPGWQGSVKDVRSYADLPTEAKAYLERLTGLLGVPISIISVGPEREQTILLENPITTSTRRQPKPDMVSA